MDGVPDNKIGGVDIERNWGNSIVIYHAPGLYTQLSHLMAGSFMRQIGDEVTGGTQVALLGNSGRSPEPHIHFQVQATPAVGSRTIRYPLRNYVLQSDDNPEFVSFGYPEKGADICNPEVDDALSAAFRWQPGKVMNWRFSKNGGDPKPISWEVQTDAYNSTYIHCLGSDSVAYFKTDNTSMEFQTFYGSRNSELFLFFTIAHRVMFVSMQNLSYKSKLPIFYGKHYAYSWLQDILSPLFLYRGLKFEFRMIGGDHPLIPSSVEFETVLSETLLGRTKYSYRSRFTIKDSKLKRVEVTHGVNTYKFEHDRQ